MQHTTIAGFLNKITNTFPNILLTYEKHVQETCSLLRLYSSATTFLDLQSLSADGHWMILRGCQNVKWLECLCNRDTTLLTDKSFFHVHWFINKYIKPKNIIYNFLRNRFQNIMQQAGIFKGIFKIAKGQWLFNIILPRVIWGHGWLGM